MSKNRKHSRNNNISNTTILAKMKFVCLSIAMAKLFASNILARDTFIFSAPRAAAEEVSEAPQLSEVEIVDYLLDDVKEEQEQEQEQEDDNEAKNNL
mmetsp:Transcript_59507/g.70916  ORF Transcript_59507/g.70916 Transcript_59507/m.70916 type:complete len:97 (+) Transcript_59507:55-345(+)